MGKAITAESGVMPNFLNSLNTRFTEESQGLKKMKGCQTCRGGDFKTGKKGEGESQSKSKCVDRRGGGVEGR